MPISYKHKIYTTLGTPTTLSGGIVSSTDSAGVPTKDYTVKGKTVVWNQLFNKNSTPNLNDTAIAYRVDGNSNIFNTTSGTTTSHPYFNFLCNTIANHKYMICAKSLKWSSTAHSGLFVGDEANPDTASYATLTSNNLAKFFTATNETCYIKSYISYIAGNYEFIMNALQLFDLTRMFGVGNEPTTAAEFRAMFPDDYYPYNAGELKSIMPEAVETKNQSGETKRVNIPSSKYFPDGMRSAGSAYDEINFLSQKAIKRIGAVDMGTLSWSYYANQLRFYCHLTGIKRASSTNTIGNIVCSKYVATSLNAVLDHIMDKTIAVTDSTYGSDLAVYDTAYTHPAAFKAAMSGVMLYYELATPVETAIAPPLRALSTFKGFNSFSAPNSLTQNGPLSVTYYAEGGTNPEKGWLTSYKRKLYMGRNIEWNQLVNYNNFQNQVITNGITFVSNGDGSIVANGTCTGDGASYNIIPWTAVNPAAKFLICGCPQGGSEFTYKIWDTNYQSYKDFGEGCVTGDMEAYSIWINIKSGTTVRDLVFKPQFFNLTKMFGAGNEPSTPEEFWSYFDHKLYPYNAGETQPLFKISRKSYIYKAPAGYTVYFINGIWIADTVTITVEYADGSTGTLTSQSDVGGKSYDNVVKMTFTDTNSERYVRYKMPANGGSEETLYMTPTATLVLTADADIEGIDK